MKKKLLSLAAAAVTLVCGALAANAQNSAFTDRDKINAVFFGGSITQGAGASDSTKTSYAALVGEWLKEEFEGKEVNVKNAGIPGTDSKYGFFRLENDVLSFDPDLVFIEFSVNDHYNDRAGTNETKRAEMKGYMESIIRKLANLPKAPAVIFVNTTDDAINSNSEKSFSDVYAELCAQYEIKAIDIESYVRDNGYVTKAGEAGTILPDGTHPNDTGYKLYADIITAALETNEYYKIPLSDAQWLSDDVNRHEYTPRSIGYSAMKFNGKWEDKSEYKAGYIGNVYMSENAGDSITLEFYGPVFCFGAMCNQWGGNFTLEIDGEIIGNYSTYNKGTWPMEFPRGTVTGLNPDVKHTAKITVLGSHAGAKDTDAANLGDNVIACRIFVADGEKDSLGKLVITDSAEVNNTVSVTVYNKSAEQISANGIFAVYNASGLLTDCSIVEAQLASKEYSAVGASVEADGADSIRVFVWDKNSVLQPVCEKIEIR